MTCGTPAIAYRRGAMAEIVDEGVTGALVASVAEAAAAVRAVGAIDRAGCRARALERFGAERMARDHVALYRALVSTGGRRDRRTRRPGGGWSISGSSLRR